MKFGGTSVADADAIRRVTALVKHAGASDATPVVVASAMAGVTDVLLNLAARAAAGDQATANDGVDAFRTRHLDVVRSLIGSAGARHVTSAIDEEVDALRGMLTAIGDRHEATPQSLDAVAAIGELSSSRIVAAALRDAGIDAQWVDARRAVVTDDSHGAAAPLMDETRVAAAREVIPALAARRIPVLGGFVGATREGVTTTLGRGGSDYSAAIVGAALAGRTRDEHGGPRIQCREIQIWTDVDGMHTADPRVVQHTRVIDRLSFAEASELAYFGAKVLHPSTILPAMAANIPVRVLNSRRGDAPGTLITAAPAPSDRPVAALACKRAITVVDVTSTRMLMAYGFLRRLFEIFERHKTAVDVVTTSEVSVSITVDDNRRVEAIAESLREFADVSVETDMAILCAVGDNLRDDPRLAVHLIAALEGFRLRMVSQAASRRNLTLVLPDRDLPAAMSKLHESWLVGDRAIAVPGANR